MEEIIANLDNIIEKPNNFLINVLDNNKISFNYIDLDIIFKYEIKKDMITLYPISFPLSYHIWRVTKKRLQNNNNNFKIDYIFDVVNCIINIITTGLYKYCTICGCEILSCNEIGYCNNICCFDIFCSLPTNNCILENYKRDAISVLFLIEIAIRCLKSERRDQVFDPFPNKYIKNNVKDFDELINITSTYSEKKLKEIINTSNSDLDISEKLGDLYSFIKFVILTNKTYIRSEKMLETKQLFNDDESLNNNKFINFQVIHNPKIEEKFKTNSPQYLFHGSSIGNWYSIMRNGLKNYSGTTMMANGAAYGNGIYLSDEISVSFQYSLRGYSGSNNSKNLYVIGVLQISDKKEQYKKAKNIYVIEDENKILLRYLILTSGSNLNTVQKYVMTDRVKEITLYNENITSIMIKRFQQELKKIDILSKKYQELKDLKVEINGYKWLINLDDEQTIEIKISDNYPVDPPFIRIVKPKIKNSVYFNDYGVVNLPELSVKKWNTKNKIADIIFKIYKLLKITDKELGEYDYNKAYESYCESILF